MFRHTSYAEHLAFNLQGIIPLHRIRDEDIKRNTAVFSTTKSEHVNTDEVETHVIFGFCQELFNN